MPNKHYQRGMSDRQNGTKGKNAPDFSLTDELFSIVTGVKTDEDHYYDGYHGRDSDD